MSDVVVVVVMVVAHSTLVGKCESVWAWAVLCLSVVCRLSLLALVVVT